MWYALGINSAFDIPTFCRYTSTMKFTWDENKRQSNLKKHGFDFRDAERVFAGEIVTVEDTRYEYEEDRFATLGLCKGVLFSSSIRKRSVSSGLFQCEKRQTMKNNSTIKQLGY